jgi:hypothetical protein
MNRALALLLAAFALLLPAVPALAQSGARVVASVSWVEEWDPVTGQWVRVEDSADTMPPPAYQATTITTVARSGAVTITETVVQEPVRFIASPPRTLSALAGTAQYGPSACWTGSVRRWSVRPMPPVRQLSLRCWRPIPGWR